MLMPRTLIDFGLVGRDRRFEAYRGAQSNAPHEPTENSLLSRPTCVQAMEWLEEASAPSPRILYLAGGPGSAISWLERLAREIRLLGFVPLNVAMLKPWRHARQEVRRWLSGRSVVLLDDRVQATDGAQLCCAFLTLGCASTRQASAIVNVNVGAREEPCPLVASAAEERAVFGAARARHPEIVEARGPGDSRAMGLLGEGRRFTCRGQHAAAERSLRAAIAAFERRTHFLHAGDAAVLLGRLLLNRGRAADALSQFERARERFQELGAAGPAVSASTCEGLAYSDLGELARADVALRSAYSAASALRDADAASVSAVALARNLYWQGGFAEGIVLLEQIPPDVSSRYWSLMARLRLASGHVEMACQAVNRAREALDERPDAAAAAIVRAAQASVQARLGDIEALHFHVRAGILAARAAHLPLQALRLQMTLAEGLLDAGLTGRARLIGARLKAWGKAPVPPLLKQRFDRLRAQLSGTTEGKTPRASMPSAREAAGAFRADQVEGVTALFSLCHGFEDEREALSGAAAIVRKQTGAVAVGIFGRAGAEAALLGSAGSLNAVMAGRCIDGGQPILPERTTTGIEAAIPISHLGRTIGAMVCRWTVEGPRAPQSAEAFARVAAAACAPLVQILLERDSNQFPQEARNSDELIGVSAAIEEVRRLITRAASAPFTVLIEGDSGSGKELVARAIHRAGCRRDRELRTLNCAALTEELVDAELFGHAKGAFTGAVSERLGLFESADGGTVFLDEVGELSARAQAKLLRTLQEGEIRRIGENFTRPIDARLIAATNRSLRAEVKAGRFRQDLLYRLDVIRIAVPPLRDRVEDIPLLAARFWREAAERIGSRAVLGQGALSALARYDWPGNVRELQNVLTGLAVAVPSRGIVPAAAMPAAIAHAMRPAARETLDTARRRFEQCFVRAELARAAGHRGQTAAALGVSRQGLAKLLQRLQLET